jgi:flagellar hook-length control protein FliK
MDSWKEYERMNLQVTGLLSNATGQVSTPNVGTASLAVGASDFAQLLQRAGQSAEPSLRADVAALPQVVQPAQPRAAQAPSPKPPEAPKDSPDSQRPSDETESEVSGEGTDDTAASERNRTARLNAQRAAERVAGRSGARDARQSAEAATPAEAADDEAAFGSAAPDSADDQALETQATAALPDGLHTLSPALASAQSPPAPASQDARTAELPGLGDDGTAGIAAAITPAAQPGAHGADRASASVDTPAGASAIANAPLEQGADSSAAMMASAAQEPASVPTALAIPEGLSPSALATEWRTAAAGGGPAATASAAASSRTEQLDTPVGASDFGAALGTRISVLARDGIEHARLNVHPAELGPIALRLVLEGTQVRVDMAADSGETRQALEQSLPALASALRDAGFTLAGGGVFQQPRDERQAQPRDDDPKARATREAEDAAAVGSVIGVRLPAPQGLVDLFA